jgi:hypothetical protein
LLPAVGLIGGMLIKSFEQFVLGMGDRLFKAITIFFPSDDEPQRSRQSSTQNISATVKAGLDRWLNKSFSILPDSVGSSWVNVKPKIGQTTDYALSYKSPEDVKPAITTIQAELIDTLPPGLNHAALRIRDDQANSRVVVSIDDAALEDFGKASTSPVNPWP